MLKHLGYLDAYLSIVLTGITGPVSINENGDRQMDFTIYNFVNNRLQAVMRYNSFVGDLTNIMAVRELT